MSPARCRWSSAAALRFVVALTVAHVGEAATRRWRGVDALSVACSGRRCLRSRCVRRELVVGLRSSGPTAAEARPRGQVPAWVAGPGLRV
jgi:hypothetical protein